MTYRDDYRDGQREFFWTLPRVLLGIFAVIVSSFLLAVVTTPLTIGFGWFQGEANLRSFNHVRDTYQFAYDHVGTLKSLQSNVCIAKLAVDASTADVKSQRETQLIAIEQTYNRVEQEYDAYMDDHFRGKVIKPADLPYPAPTLDLSVC